MSQDRGTQVSFEAAIEELEAIVAALQQDEVGVDELAARVARGAELVELCRQRLRRAEVAVEEVVDGLRAAEAAEQAPEPPAAGTAPATAPASEDQLPLGS